MWTVARVKDELPSVKVHPFGGHVRMASVKGSLNQWATVYCEGWSWEVSWETLVRCLNNDTAIIV